MYKKINKLIFLLLAIAYCALAFIYMFLPKLNEKVSVWFFVAQFISFPLFFGLLILSFTFIRMVVKFFKQEFKLIDKLSLLLVVVAFLLFNVNSLFNHYHHRQLTNYKTLKIVEFNALNYLDHDTISKIFREFDADIVIFPELGVGADGTDVKTRLRPLFDQNSLDLLNYQVYTSKENITSIAPVTVIVKNIWPYQRIDSQINTTFGTVYLKARGSLPDIVGLHTAPPLPTMMSFWRHDLWMIVNDIIPKHKNAIIAGDFNATLKHGTLNNIEGYVDVLSSLNGLNNGTWKADFPQYFKTCIDHILIPDNSNIKEVKLHKLGISDHMATFAIIEIEQ